MGGSDPHQLCLPPQSRPPRRQAATLISYAKLATYDFCGHNFSTFFHFLKKQMVTGDFLEGKCFSLTWSQNDVIRYFQNISQS